ncbi:Uncharacterized protein K3495_g10875 [Podosphaera aphanis]|nr:Uncharacterized protein K3495_g10875 [Podosphaera aphanis]
MPKPSPSNSPDTRLHTSDNLWRHQESTSFHRHAQGLAGDYADEPISTRQTTKRHSRNIEHVQEYHDPASSNNDVLTVSCGPLLNYRRMENETWFGSVLVVTSGDGINEDPPAPELSLKIGRAKANSNEYQNKNQPRNTHANNSNVYIEVLKVKAIKLYSDSANTFWRFDLKVPMQEYEVQCQYNISRLVFLEENKSKQQEFFVPAISMSMRIMFHSCNGFSVGTDEDAFSGACLWNDVFREHKRSPFHVMIGGGDQIYNDGIRVNGPLRSWTEITSPHEREKFLFSESLRKDCDKYYVNNYIRWYGNEPFASCNGQIPQLNIWDDHDIIDGFGSYVKSFMNCPVFRGIGGVAHKYYLLFQHHLAPPQYSYTSDAPRKTHSNSIGIDPREPENTYVLKEPHIDPSYITGDKPGPYLKESSHSIYTRLGARVAFFGIDARTERTRTQVNYPDTYEKIFKRIRKELRAAKKSASPIRHLIVLLGIPIAYPRLTWLENIFRSPVVGPVRFLNKRFGFGGSLFNHFDGNVDLLDDLDDHYTARAHKGERRKLIHQLQDIASEFSVRITILGGDVHLAAVGRFYSNPRLCTPVSEDHRYMANIISSAIVNKPPPQAVANLLALRNKIHHLDEDTDETLMKFFDKVPGKSSKGFNSNLVTMPRRNWAMITENPLNFQKRTSAKKISPGQMPHITSCHSARKLEDGHTWLHDGEAGAGTQHKAAKPEEHGTGDDGSLDICIRVEINQHDKEGKTELYGMTIPLLKMPTKSKE